MNLFINGKKVSENTVELLSEPLKFLPVYIGTSPYSPYINFTGNIEEFLITEKLLHEEDFTPPDKPYKKDKFTKVLLHFGGKKSNS